MRRVGGGGRGGGARGRHAQGLAAPAPAPAPEPGGLATLTKEQLRAECRRRGQRCSGNKAELLCRLGAHKAGAALPPCPRLEHPAAPGPAPAAAVLGTAAAGPAARNGIVKHSAHGRAARGMGMRGAGEGAGEVKAPVAGEEVGAGAGVDEAAVATLVLWRRPGATLQHAAAELLLLARHALAQRSVWGAWAAGAGALLALLAALLLAPGPHQPLLQEWWGWWWWWCWWVALGVLSSVGLGTGLHTFLLYLGPHIARVTLAARACRSLAFPAPPYPHQIVCPPLPALADAAPPSVWAIMSKVRVESMLWGVGTALGELPPYFMARAARLSGRQQQQQQQQGVQQQSRAGALVEACVARVGFLGILVCASVPNPLFDLAGLTCGHCLVPFPTFFGATLLGKAVVKMHLQKLFVIVALDEQLVGAALQAVARLPLLGPRLHPALRDLLARQRHQLGAPAPGEPALSADAAADGWLGWALDKLVLAMVTYFLVSILNSLAQAHARRTRTSTAPSSPASPASPPSD